MEKLLLTFSLSLAISTACSNAATANEFASVHQTNAQRPNIVLFLCDDLGYGDLECYGHPKIKTPNLNQLAADGIRFTDCYSAAPVCSPSRVGLLTGRSPNRAGVYDWIPWARPGKPQPESRDQVHMRCSEITIPALLKSAGYATCMAGKWHCNSTFNDDAQPQPGDFGFDHWLATQNNAAPTHENPINFVRNGTKIGKTNDFSCQIVVQESIDWLKAQQAKDTQQPFFIYIPFHEPHERVASPKALVDEYIPDSKNEDQAQYFANVANVDKAVGKMLQTLKDMGLTENTLVIFTSDNGPETLNRYKTANRSHGTPGPLRGMKLHTHDAGFRVPGIVRWPSKIKSGQTINTPVSSLDFLPTFCDLAGAELPSRKLDGVSLRPLFEEASLTRANPLFWCYFNSLNDACVAMRDGDLKVLMQINGGKLGRMQNLTSVDMKEVMSSELTDLEIYNVREDIAESKNLAKTDPELAGKMRKKMNKHFRSLNAGSHVWEPNGVERKSRK